MRQRRCENANAPGAESRGVGKKIGRVDTTIIAGFCHEGKSFSPVFWRVPPSGLFDPALRRRPSSHSFDRVSQAGLWLKTENGWLSRCRAVPGGWR
jgi:hypothetical protein